MISIAHAHGKGYSIYMNILRRIVNSVALYVIVPLFFITAGFYAFFSIVNANSIKQALKDENVYATIVPAALKTTASTNISTGPVPLKEPWVLNAANTAFPASDLEQKTNTAIDSTFEWLDGKTDKPAFTIDLSSNKAAFATQVGEYAQNRYAGLPVCSRSSLPDTSDPLAINCRVPYINPSTVGSTLSQQVTTDKNFLANPVISSTNASLNPVNQAAQTDPFKNLDGLRSIYQSRTLILWGLPMLILLCTGIGIGLAMDRARALRHLSRAFLFNTVSLIAIGLLLGVGFNRLIDTFSIDAITSTVVGPVVSNLGAHAQKVYFIFAGISALIALICYMIARFLRQQTKQVQPRQFS